MSNLEKYQDVFVRVLETTPDALNENFTFSNVEQWDSVAHLNLISELEEAFDVLFESEDILHFGSYENGLLILKRYGVDLP